MGKKPLQVRCAKDRRILKAVPMWVCKRTRINFFSFSFFKKKKQKRFGKRVCPDSLSVTKSSLQTIYFSVAKMFTLHFIRRRQCARTQANSMMELE